MLDQGSSINVRRVVDASVAMWQCDRGSVTDLSSECSTDVAVPMVVRVAGVRRYDRTNGQDKYAYRQRIRLTWEHPVGAIHDIGQKNVITGYR